MRCLAYAVLHAPAVIMFVIVLRRPYIEYRTFKVVPYVSYHAAGKLDYRPCPAHSTRIYRPIPLLGHGAIIPRHIPMYRVLITLTEIWNGPSCRLLIPDSTLVDIVGYLPGERQVYMIEGHKMC